MSTSQRQVNAARTADPILRWLLMVAFLIFAMVLIGGFVRLSRAGLSIVEWDVVTGILPPIGDAAWQQSFAEYKLTPEYLLVNQGMSLGDYQYIFFLEWFHRLIARIAGLLVIAPLIWFMYKRTLSFAESLRYWIIVALFGIQGAIGWIMVASGLVDRPVVSHFRLTIHLLAALTLLGIVLWMAFDRSNALRPPTAADESPNQLDLHPAAGGVRTMAWVLMGAVVVQIAYGGLVAGLKAGHVSNTWPLMSGQLIPPGLLTNSEPWWVNLYESVGAHWIHRWLAFVVAGVAIATVIIIRRDLKRNRTMRAAGNWLVVCVAAQIVLGIYTVLFDVQKWLALAHQGVGVVVFGVAVVIAHRTSAPPRLAPRPVSARPTR